ncbi:hypothetical protein [Alcaligenes faecalis]|uniref:hypothetical protein n=1 Tax=Alcaligenes faecalis TaxID=511 RepID=UPI000F0BC156|nr:hypothetical protein [Alcaligenes faecalis]AYR21496.1 hypothetical protein D6I95_14695 [Alcaligenes faecalis]
MASQCIEIVTYKIENPIQADQQRDSARQRVSTLSGFKGWLPLTDSMDQSKRADIVLWDNPKAAETAAQIVAKSDDFADFRATITEFGTMGHYTTAANEVVLMQTGSGIEVGQFRLRQGFSEEALRAAHTKMVNKHLSLQPGWLGQRLVRLQDGSFMDIAFATTDTHAQNICRSWAGNADCNTFLDMIEPISMEFGTLI